MRFAGLFIGFAAVALLALPSLPAQEKKKDDKAEKTDTKDDKKDEKKEPEKKEPEKKEPKEKEPKKPIEEKPDHGPVVKSKIISMKPDSAREFTIEVPMPDPQKIAAVQLWSAQRLQQIMNVQNPAQRQNELYQYQMQLTQKQANETFTMKPVDVKASENCKVRMMYPAPKYDDNGNLHKYTKKELDAMRANTKLPGYPAEFDMLKTGQWIELYLAKQQGSPKDKWAGPKKKKDDDPPDVAEVRPEVVMIVIWAEPMGR